MPKLTPGTAAQLRGGMLSRIGDAVRYAIRGVQPNTWMSPQQPIAPQVPQAAGRLIDYRTGYNLQYVPRGEEAISFGQLRALADNCDLVRLAIETRKDQIGSLLWDIAHTDPDKDLGDDARADAAQALLAYPDGRRPWRTWLREIVEEVLVTDAPAIYPRKTNGGDILSLDVMDGATLKVLTDADGRLPQPPDPAYQQRLKGIPAVNYAANEVIYMPRNPRSWKFYGYSPVEQVAMTINIAIRRALSQLQYFTEGNIPEAFASLPVDWTGAQIADFQEYWDSVLEGDQAYKRKVKFVPGGTKVEQTKNAVLQDTFDEWLARVVCYAFSLPPTQFTKQTNRATSDTLQEAAVSEGLAPLMAWVKDVMDHIIQRVFGYADLQFVWREEDALDPAQQSTILTTYLHAGAMTINEVRGKIGLDPVEGGDTTLIYSGTGAVPLETVLKPPEPATEPGKPADGKPMPKDEATKDAPDEKKKCHHAHDLTKAASDDLLRPPVAETEQEKAMTAVFVETLSEVRDAVAKQWRAADVAVTEADDAQVQAIAESFADKADLSAFSLAWDDYQEALIATAADGAKTVLVQVSVSDPALVDGIDFLNHRDPRAVAWAKEHAGEMLSSDGSGGELIDATRAMMRQTIAQAIEDNITRAEFAQRLMDAYAFSKDRAELIAVTELRNAQGHGSLEGYRSVGMTQKKWLLSNSEGVCPVCSANQAQGYIPIGEAFSSGDQAPLAHPRCRCDIVARLKPEN